MGNTVYRTVSGSVAQLRRLDVLANNLANAETPGFKADRVSFREALDAQKRGTKFVDVPSAELDLSVGSLQTTDSPLDVALSGSGFLVADSPSGARLTRGGRLATSDDGTLTTVSGLPLLSTNGGPIRVAMRGAGSEFPLQISESGVVSQGDRTLGTLMRKEAAGASLERLGEGLYGVQGGPFGLPNATSATVRQGAVEGSNVSPVLAMTELVDVQRNFDALQQVMKVYREIDEQSNRRMR